MQASGAQLKFAKPFWHGWLGSLPVPTNTSRFLFPRAQRWERESTYKEMRVSAKLRFTQSNLQVMELGVQVRLCCQLLLWFISSCRLIYCWHNSNCAIGNNGHAGSCPWLLSLPCCKPRTSVFPLTFDASRSVEFHIAEIAYPCSYRVLALAILAYLGNYFKQMWLIFFSLCLSVAFILNLKPPPTVFHS